LLPQHDKGNLIKAQRERKNMEFVFQTDEDTSNLESIVEQFLRKLDPVEGDKLLLLKDECTGAIYTECHIAADTIFNNSTDDVPLDPDASTEYRANRQLVDDHAAYKQMEVDAIKGRSFSNFVCEFIPTDEKSLKIIGGQHRYNALKSALEVGVNVIHGLKVYFGLSKDQRLDVQVISNTNITVSRDLLDRMYETIAGSDLRDWCQRAGLLAEGEDFTDKRKRGSPISVSSARNFIVNFYAGKDASTGDFATTNTTPVTTKTGSQNPPDWVRVKKEHPELWEDADLLIAAKEYANLRQAQEDAFLGKGGKPQPGTSDFRDKANNMAIVAAWAYTAGFLQNNSVRLQKHYDLKTASKADPLKAAVLAKAKHGTDPDNYRGLGYRTDPQERGRMVELFWIQAEKGGGITQKMVEVALEAYHAKHAVLRHKRLAEDLA
jgi:hypothetical protein